MFFRFVLGWWELSASLPSVHVVRFLFLVQVNIFIKKNCPLSFILLINVLKPHLERKPLEKMFVWYKSACMCKHVYTCVHLIHLCMSMLEHFRCLHMFIFTHKYMCGEWLVIWREGFVYECAHVRETMHIHDLSFLLQTLPDDTIITRWHDTRRFPVS